MRPFNFITAESREHALKLVADNKNAKFIGGGTNLLDLMKLEIEAPSLLIDISRTDLGQIEKVDDGRIAIGASVTNSALAANMDVRRDYPVLSRALLAGASGQLRNKATTGGNLLQRTRCQYFYDTAQACNKRLPGSGCSAKGGFSRQLAVLDIDDSCIASFPSDMAVALRVLDAEIELVSLSGTRMVPIGDFYSGTSMQPHIDTVLKHDELITRIILPRPLGGSHFYEKVRDRASYAFAIVSAAMVFQPDGSARVAFGGLAPKPWRVEFAEKLLTTDIDEYVRLAFSGARATHENQFKIPLAKQILKTLISKHREL
ncbi:FAD binding domain-containing protein [Halioxenophilus aromaticivorans]|uniref:Xanthine dehydrogenase family protein subunit M n=1 Tax=Halioxenophilus aromaticivorans TaxID=1306992 RepID=A0AAV3U3H3_9ALTE